MLIILFEIVRVIASALYNMFIFVCVALFVILANILQIEIR